MTKGFFIDKNGRTVIFENGETTFQLTKEDAQALVDRSNQMIEEYSENFANEMGGDEVFFADWIRYNEGLLPYIRKAAALVHELHKDGFTEYKVNMQSGIIK